MAPHSSTLAWKIPWTEGSGGPQSTGSLRVGHDWSDLACMHACFGGGNGNPLQYSCLENTRDRGAWWAAIYGVTQSWTRLKHFSSSSSRNQLNNILFTSVLKISSNEITHTQTQWLFYKISILLFRILYVRDYGLRLWNVLRATQQGLTSYIRQIMLLESFTYQVCCC